MATLSLILPTIGNPDATEDVKLNNALTTIQAWSTSIDVDNLANGSIAAAWTAFTPTWSTSGTQPVLGNGTLVGAFLRVGKLVNVRMYLQPGSTTTYGTGVWAFGLPFAVRGDGSYQSISGYVAPGTGGGVYSAFGILAPGATFLGAWSQGAQVTLTSPAVWIAGSTLQLQGAYESA